MKRQSAFEDKATASVKTVTVGIAVDPMTLSLLTAGKISLKKVAAKYGVSRKKITRELALMIRAGLASPSFLTQFESVRSRHADYEDAVVLPGEDVRPAPSAKAAPVRDDGDKSQIRELQRRISAAQARERDLLDQLTEGTAMSRVLAGLEAHKPQPDPTWLTGAEDAAVDEDTDLSVPILVLTDMHLGERVFPETSAGYRYDVEIARGRVKRTVEKTVRLLRKHLAGLRYPGIILALGGDNVSGALHPELAETDELGVLPSVTTALDVLTSAIDALKREFGQVFVPTAVGNHGRVFDRRPRAKGYAERNIDWHIYSLLAWHYRDDPDVIIRLPKEGETAFETLGMRFMLTHGDRLGAKGGDGIIGAIGPIMRGSTKTFNSLESVGVDVDHMIMGHWHQQIHLKRVTVCGSLKGPDEYTMRMLRAPAEDPSQTLIVVHPENGITFRQPVFLRDEHCPPARIRGTAGGGWVNAFDRQAA